VSAGGGLGIAGFTNLAPDVVRERLSMLTCTPAAASTRSRTSPRPVNWSDDCGRSASTRPDGAGVA
jgi:hypothetical protein